MAGKNGKSRFDSVPLRERVILENQSDLSTLGGQKVLVLLDEQNLSITARKLGFRLQYKQLAQRIISATTHAELHIFTDTDACDQCTRQQFEKAGYRVHLKKTRRVSFRYGRQHCDSNIDNLFAFWTGIYVAQTSCRVVVLGSGDYGLSGELSQAIRERWPVQITTLSLPGSTAQDLDARKNNNITANLEIGLDLMKPLSFSQQRYSA